MSNKVFLCFWIRKRTRKMVGLQDYINVLLAGSLGSLIDLSPLFCNLLMSYQSIVVVRFAPLEQSSANNNILRLRATLAIHLSRSA
ncbi:hypothetical protein VNO78_26504 [Psophocarpus tetragonolobus]|uniref:Uncharacterized protein n=1 Tax=Psophocarpus tetragonolobus TaxID=3891 RepID=A0AAN9X8Z8_PSOTE